MKLTKPKSTETKSLVRKGKRGPIPTVGGERMNFFPGDSLDLLPKLNKLYKRNKIKRITKSYAIREAVKIWLRERLREVKLAEKGEFHAKKRK